MLLRGDERYISLLYNIVPFSFATFIRPVCMSYA